MPSSETAGSAIRVPAAYWWTHSTLEEEATPPDATAAEATGTAVSTVVATVKQAILDSIASWGPSSAPPTADGSAADRQRLFASLGLTDQLPPLLTQVRRTMEKAWWERRGDEEDAAAHPHGLSRNKSKRTESASAAAAAVGAALDDDRTRAKLEEVQRQVLLLFLKAVLQGAVAAVREARADAALSDDVKTRGEALFAICMDGLLADMCFGNAGGQPASPWKDTTIEAEMGRIEEGEEEHPRRAPRREKQLKSAWSGGAIQSLHRRGAEETEHATAMSLALLECAAQLLSEELGLSTLDRAHNFPQLTGAANRLIGDKLRSLTGRVRAFSDGVAGGQGASATAEERDTPASVTNIQKRATFFQFSIAPVIHAIGAGLLLCSADEFAASSAALLPGSGEAVGTDGGAAPVETAASLALLFRIASLSAVTTLASGQEFLNAFDDLLKACHTVYTAARQFAHKSDEAANTTVAEEEEKEAATRGAVDVAMKALKTAYQDRIGRQAHALVAVLSQFASTQPLLFSAARTLLATCYSASGAPNYRYYVGDISSYQQKHAGGATPSSFALQSGAAKHYSTSNAPQLSSAALASSASSASAPPRVAMAWQSFADVCLARVSTLAPAVVENAPEALFAFLAQPSASSSMPAELEAVALPLGVSLLVHPTATLQRLVALATSPLLLSRSCSADAAVTETGGGSERRARAFREVAADSSLEPPSSEGALSSAPPAASHEAALVFFPRLYAAFCAVEAALRGLLLHRSGDSSSDAADAVGEGEATLAGVLSAALRHLLRSVAKDGPAQVAAGELPMFVAFALSSTPVYPVAHLRIVRQALRGALDRDDVSGGSGGAGADACEGEGHHVEEKLLLLLHRQVVRAHGLGALVFFLPLLRAVGVDHGAAADLEHVACGVRYPASAAVAYLSELPHSYFARRAHGMALHQKDDALAYWDRLVFSKLTVPTGQAAEAETEAAGDSSVEIFVDLISEAGKVVLGRLSEMRLTGAVGSGAPPVFSSASFTPSATAPLVVDVLSNVFFGVLRLCTDVTHWRHAVRAALQKRIVARVVEKLTREAAECTGHGSPTAASDSLIVFPMEYLLRRVCPDSEADDDGGATAAAAAAEAARPTEALSAFERWLWAAELDAVDDAPYQAVKGLVRVCNVSYMKQVSTQTLLHARSVIDTQAEKRRAARESVLATLDAAVANDLDSIRRVLDTRDRKLAGGSKANGHDAAPVKEKDVEDHSAPPAAAPPRELLLSQVQSYLGFVFNALLLRARVSVVDGTVCGIALERLFSACARHRVDPVALSGLLRVLLARIRSVMAVASIPQQQQQQQRCVATRQEVAGLSVLLSVAGGCLALPYKMSFAPPSSLPTSAGAVVALGQVTREMVEAAGRIFPKSDEAEAVNTLTIAIENVTGLVKQFLGRLTLLADWCAHAVVLHCRPLFRLVTRYEEVFHRAVVARREAVRLSGIHSPGFQALVGVERPLVDGLSGPAESVARLFTSARAAAAESGHRDGDKSSLHGRHRTRAGRQERERRERKEAAPAAASPSRSHPTNRRETDGGDRRKRDRSADREQARDRHDHHRRRDSSRDGGRRGRHEDDRRAADGADREEGGWRGGAHRSDRRRGGRNSERGGSRR